MLQKNLLPKAGVDEIVTPLEKRDKTWKKLWKVL